jgi:hypothetical protein
MSSLENMLIKCIAIKSCIGEYVGKVGSGDDDYIITGIGIQNSKDNRDDNLYKYLGSCSIGYNKIPVFGRFKKEGIECLFREYLDEKYKSNSEKVVNYKTRMLERLRGLQTNDLLIVPVAIGRRAEYVYEGAERHNGTIDNIIYKINKDTFKVESKIKTTNKFDGVKEFDFTEFGKTWNLHGAKACCEEADDNLIEMMPSGVIKPINIGGKVIVDNLYIYKMTPIGLRIVGKITEDGYKLTGVSKEDIAECKELHKFMRNITYLSHMQRVIGVYGLNEEKKVEVEDNE